MQFNIGGIFVILKVLAVNYPIMRALGYVLSKPILLLGNQDDFERQRRWLTNHQLPIINVTTKMKEQKDIYMRVNMDFCGIIFNGGNVKKWIEKVQEFDDRLHVDTKDMSPPVLVFADGRILDEKCEDFHIVFVEGVPEKEILLDEIVPKDIDLPVIIDKIDEIASKGTTQIERVLLAAVCFTYPILKANDRMDGFKVLLDHARLLAEQSEGGVVDGIAEMFIDESYRWQKDTRFKQFIRLPQLSMLDVDQMEGSIFYDDTFLFMTESMFKQIAGSLLQTFPERLLKFSLMKEDILKPENTSTFTAKMNYRSVAGTYERIRMLRFQRSRFIKYGDIDFVQDCFFNKEGEKC